MDKTKEWAVITGVSKGLGYQYAKELIKQGYNIVAVARNCEGVKNKLTANSQNQEIRLFNLDLTQERNIYQLYETCADLNVTLVINNAGFGVWGDFVNCDIDQEINMISLNIVALHLLTKLFLKNFCQRDNGKIINIASLAAFTPGPGFASYYASKAYVLNLSIAINTELKIQNLQPRVIAICPGPLKTAFWSRAAALKEPKEKHSALVSPLNLNKFAVKSLNRALKTKNRNYVIFGFINHLACFVFKFTPQRWFLRSVYRYQKAKTT